MRVRIDPEGLAGLELVSVSDEHGDRRRYYATGTGPRLLVVCRAGLVLSELAGATVDAALGWDHGAAGFVWRPGERHSKLTIYGRAKGRAEATLSGLKDGAPG